MRKRAVRITSHKSARASKPTISQSKPKAERSTHESSAVLMPEYSRPYPQKLAIAAPSAVRESPVDMNEACEHIGLAIGQALQLRLPLDLQALFEDTRDTVLLRELLSIEHPFELGHYRRVLRECRGSPPQRARCFRALLLGRCLDHAKNDPARAFGILRRCTEAAPRLGARDLAAPMDPGPVRDQDLRGAFVSILRMVVPRAQMRVVVSPGGAQRLAVLDPSSCALALDRLMHRLRRGAEQEEEQEEEEEVA